MSIKSTKIDGDVSVGRHVSMGGDARVAGNAAVQGNMVVEGWLDAKNIKGAGKGLFRTVEELRTAYGTPDDGWWALVGDELPADLWVAYGKAWVQTGKKSGSAEVDLASYRAALAAVRDELGEVSKSLGETRAQQNGIRGELTEAKKRLVETQEKQNGIREELTEAKDRLTEAQNKQKGIRGELDDAKKRLNGAVSGLEDFKSQKGAAGGLAELDDEGHVRLEALGDLPERLKTVEKTAGVVGRGGRTVLNVNVLCGDVDYTLSTAIKSVQEKGTREGISLLSSGTVLTFRTLSEKGVRLWKAYQYVGEIENLNSADPNGWVEFGSGGGHVETSDEVEKDGTAAFSTGGAYRAVPSGLRVNTETEGVVKMAMVNAAGDVVGEEVQFAASGGGGSMPEGAAIVLIAPEKSTLSASRGGDFVCRCAVRSVTRQSGVDLLNPIERIEVWERDGALLEMLRVNRPSSGSVETYDFAIDLGKYMTETGVRRFVLKAYDEAGNNGMRNITAVCVDVGLVSVGTLHYTLSSSLMVGGESKRLPLYRFPVNLGTQGIRATIEMLKDGRWQTIGEELITDTYSHSVSIDPKNCLGGALSHGGYLVRVHGEDVASGVVGNYLYTTVMVVDAGVNRPIVGLRWLSNGQTGAVGEYEMVELEYAAYSRTAARSKVELVEVRSGVEKVVTRAEVGNEETGRFLVRTSGVGAVGYKARVGQVQSGEAAFHTESSSLGLEWLKDQLVVELDFRDRSNAEVDPTIKSGAYTLSVEGGNRRSNGFVADKKGVVGLRFGEGMHGVLDYKPFNRGGIETTGLAVAMRLSVVGGDSEGARLLECMTSGFGFYVTSREVVVTMDDEATTAYTVRGVLSEGTATDVCIVYEPTREAPYSGVGVVKLYFDGELVGACRYTAGSLPRNNTPMKMDGSDGALTLYALRVWETYYGFAQAFDHYLLGLNNVDGMLQEHTFNNVLQSSVAEGVGAKLRPAAEELYERGLAYFVLCKNGTTGDGADMYPEYLETLDGDKKTTRKLDVYFYDPQRPWQNFKAIGATVSNQGTTSAMRPIKNVKLKLKGAQVALLTPRDAYDGDAQAKWDECAENAKKGKVQILDTSVPTNIVTVKVDYSESGGANNGASTQLYNELQRALGRDYMTPAQNAYKGKHVLKTSIDSVPCVFFRTDRYSADATNPKNGYFHAKGNWNQDKGDAVVFGFEKVAGYNDSCLNYGDFVEVIAGRGQTLTAFLAGVNKEGWDKSRVVVVTEFCGPDYKVFRHDGAHWNETTGEMKWEGGTWRITGDVLNPVENYEIKVYDGMAWFQGVKSEEDMLRPDTKGVPTWLTYFESRYPDNKELERAYKEGRKLPYRLFAWLKWCNECSHHQSERDGEIEVDGVSMAGSVANRGLKFRRELHKMANVKSVLCYHVFTDYLNAVDQRSKNMMVGFYKEADGAVRMYLNHLYDGDTILGSDNEGGVTVSALLDPDKSKGYQGWDSVLFKRIAEGGAVWLKDYERDEDAGDSTRTTTVAAVAGAMREVKQGDGFAPFSVLGLQHYWVGRRLSKFPKLVSSYDGLRKYVEHSREGKDYFYVLHGLSTQRLVRHIEERFAYRDGYYGVGDALKSSASFRCYGEEMEVRIKAARRGYFGLGVDRSNEARVKVYLEAGEEATLRSGTSSTGGDGVALYLFGAENVAELDLRRAMPKSWNITELKRLRKLTLGGKTWTAVSGVELLGDVNLNALENLREVDVRNFPVKSLNAEKCLRLRVVLAEGSALRTFMGAEGGELSRVVLPTGLESLKLVGIKGLKLGADSLSLGGVGRLQSIVVKECPGLSGLDLLASAVMAGAKPTHVEVDSTDVDVLYGSAVLGAVIAAGGAGNQWTGVWRLTDFVEDDVLARYGAAFPNLRVKNAEWTCVVIDENRSDPMNLTNPDNVTSGATYAPSGHVLRLRKGFIPVLGKKNSEGVMVCRRVDETDYRRLANGEAVDYSDGSDLFMRWPGCWYKGVNDPLNGKQYMYWSSQVEAPTAAKGVRVKKVKECVVAAGTISQNVPVGTEWHVGMVNGGYAISGTREYYTGMMDCRPGDWVRLPMYGSVFSGGFVIFLNAENKVVEMRNMGVQIQTLPLAGYLLFAVPEGAVRVVFPFMTEAGTAQNGDLPVVVSPTLEGIEPEWQRSEPWLVGVFDNSLDVKFDTRSMQGVATADVAVSYGGSELLSVDGEGRPLKHVVITEQYNGKPLLRVTPRFVLLNAQLRGAGYGQMDYEMWKLLRLLWWHLSGTRDINSKVGMATNRDYQKWVDYRVARAVGNVDGTPNGVGMGQMLGICNLLANSQLVLDGLCGLPDYEKWVKGGRLDDNQELKMWVTMADGRVVGWPNVYNTSYVTGIRMGGNCDVVPARGDTQNYRTHFLSSFPQKAKGTDTCVTVSGGWSMGFAPGYSSYLCMRLAYRGRMVVEE